MPDLRLGELDVDERRGRDFRHDRIQLRLAEPEAGGRPLVEFLRELAHRAVAALADVVEDALDGLAHLAVELVRDFGGDAALEIGGHRVPRRGMTYRLIGAV